MWINESENVVFEWCLNRMKFVANLSFLLLVLAEGQEVATTLNIGTDFPPEPVVSALPNASSRPGDDDPHFPASFHSDDEDVAEIQRRAFRWLVRVYNQTASFLRSLFNHLNELELQDRKEIAHAAQKVEKVSASTYDEHFLAPDKPTIAPTLRLLQEGHNTADAVSEFADKSEEETAAEAEGVAEAIDEFADLIVESTEAALDLDVVDELAMTTESPQLLTEKEQHFQDCVNYIVDYATEKIEDTLGEENLDSGILSLSITSKIHSRGGGSAVDDDELERTTAPPLSLTL